VIVGEQLKKLAQQELHQQNASDKYNEEFQVNHHFDIEAHDDHEEEISQHEENDHHEDHIRITLVMFIMMNMAL